MNIKKNLLLFILLWLVLNSKNIFATIPVYGHWNISCGIHLWENYSVLRNLQLTSLIYFPKNIRFNSVIRSNNSFNSIENVAPQFDEGYLQWQSFKKSKKLNFANSLKIGQLRYLRFPEPDIISMFDQVPGTEDQLFGIQTAYRGVMLNQEITYKSYGTHTSLLQWIGSEQKGLNLIEGYLFYRKYLKIIDIEARIGQLAERVAPLGKGSLGYSLYLGLKHYDLKAGLLYEFLESEAVRTGILVQFNQNPINKLLGKLRTDYTRSPEGIGFQPTLLKGKIGIVKKVPNNYKKVGEVITEQIITYWQNGQGRNFYEHILEKKGQTEGKNLLIKIEEKEQYLKIESLVSRHNSFKNWDDLVEWEKKRQGPAQLNKTVIYTYYEKI